MKPLFSEQNNSTKHITLIEGDDIITDDIAVAEIMNDVFANSILHLNVRGYEAITYINTTIVEMSNIIVTQETP